MHRPSLFVAALLLSATALASSASTAAAQPFGPDTAACEQANADVLVKALDAATASKALADANAVVLGALQLNVEKAQEEHQTAFDAYKKDPTEANLANLVTAQKALQDALETLQNQAPDGPLEKALVDAQARLQAAVDVRVKVCAPPPATTPTPTPTPAPAPEPPNDLDCADLTAPGAAQAKLDEDQSDPHRLDVDGDGIACEVEEGPAPQVRRAPTGSVDTGTA